MSWSYELELENGICHPFSNSNSSLQLLSRTNPLSPARSAFLSCTGCRRPKGTISAGIPSFCPAPESNRPCQARVPTRGSCRADAPRGTYPRARGSNRTASRRHRRCCWAGRRDGRATCTSSSSGHQFPQSSPLKELHSTLPGRRSSRRQNPSRQFLRRDCARPLPRHPRRKAQA